MLVVLSAGEGCQGITQEKLDRLRALQTFVASRIWRNKNMEMLRKGWNIQRWRRCSITHHIHVEEYPVALIVLHPALACKRINKKKITAMIRMCTSVTFMFKSKKKLRECLDLHYICSVQELQIWDGNN